MFGLHFQHSNTNNINTAKNFKGQQAFGICVILLKATCHFCFRHTVDHHIILFLTHSICHCRQLSWSPGTPIIYMNMQDIKII